MKTIRIKFKGEDVLEIAEQDGQRPKLSVLTSMGPGDITTLIALAALSLAQEFDEDTINVDLVPPEQP